MRRIKKRHILVGIVLVVIILPIVLIINSIRISNAQSKQLGELLDSIPTYQGAITQGVTKKFGSFPEGYRDYSFRFTSDEKIPNVMQFYHDYFIRNGWELYEAQSEISAFYRKNINGKVNQIIIYSNPNFGDKNLYSISVDIIF